MRKYSEMFVVCVVVRTCEQILLLQHAVLANPKLTPNKRSVWTAEGLDKKQESGLQIDATKPGVRALLTWQVFSQPKVLKSVIWHEFFCHWEPPSSWGGSWFVVRALIVLLSHMDGDNNMNKFSWTAIQKATWHGLSKLFVSRLSLDLIQVATCQGGWHSSRLLPRDANKNRPGRNAG